MVITLFVGGHQVLTHRSALVISLPSTTYMLMLTWPIIALGWVVNLCQRGTASVVRIDELLSDKPTIDDARRDPRSRTTSRLQGDIEFRNLTFAYPVRQQDRSRYCKSLSLKVPAGTSLAIVGPTGSGKSTLVNLIARLYDADPGMRTDRWTSHSRLSARSAAFESWLLYPRRHFYSARRYAENIAFGAPEASEEQVMRAAEAAHIRKEFEDFPRRL